MAEQPSPIQFEDVPLDEARRMGRSARMEPMLADAVRVRLGPEIRPERMKNYILRIGNPIVFGPKTSNFYKSLNYGYFRGSAASAVKKLFAEWHIVPLIV
jgi:hypothetical protein